MPTRYPDGPTSKAIVAKAKETLRNLNVPEDITHPGNFVRWHGKVGDKLWEILESVNWFSIENPTAYLTAVIRDTDPSDPLPDHEIKKSDSGFIVILRDQDHPTRVREVLRGSEALRFIAAKTSPAAPSHQCPDPVSQPTL